MDETSSWEDPLATDEERREDYREFLASPEWNRTKWEVMARHKFKCVYCKKAWSYTLHHLRYDMGWLNEEYLIPVCRSCHRMVHRLTHVNLQALVIKASPCQDQGG